MRKIILITYNDPDNYNKEYVSHGVDFFTMGTVILPNQTPRELGAVFDKNDGWVLYTGIAKSNLEQ